MFQRLFLLVVLLGLLVVGSQSVFAQEVPSDAPVIVVADSPTAPPAESVPEWRQDAQDYLIVLIYGLVGLVLIFGSAVLLVLLGNIMQWGFKQYKVADAKLAPFGQTPYGMAVYSGLGKAYGLFDSPNDPAVRLALEVFNKVLPVKDDLLTDDEVMAAARTAINGVRTLFDGVGLPGTATPEDLVNTWRKQ